MISNCIKSILEDAQLQSTLYEHFRKTIVNWKQENPEEIFGIREEELNEEGLIFHTLRIYNADNYNYSYRIEVEYLKKFSNNLKAIYVLKFWDNLDVYDDVFYTIKDH